MTNLILVRPAETHIPEIHTYREECRTHDTHSHGDSGLYNTEDIAAWVNLCHLMENQDTIPNPQLVPAHQFMLMHKNEPRILGMINLRHYLKEGYLTEHGGHIGYGVRPTERRKGYAKAMLKLCLEECRKLGLDKVLLCCDLDNHGSRATIKANGGKFERLGITGGEVDERYWITINNENDTQNDPPQATNITPQVSSQSHPPESIHPFKFKGPSSAESPSPLTQSTNIISNFYATYDEDARLATRFGLVEYLTTMRYIDKYLTKGDKVLEIGAGTGRYSRTIADMGHNVEAVELTPHNIDLFRKAIKPGQEINITQGNALDLSKFNTNSFEITLILGPLYHLFTPEDKRRAISEALRVTKPGGIVFVAYCMSDPSIVEGGFSRKRYSVAEMIERGLIDPATFATTSRPEDIFELVRTEDIHTLMADFPVQRLHLVATDLFSRFIRESLDTMDDETFALYLRYHFAVCERPDLLGASHHLLDIFRKK